MPDTSHSPPRQLDVAIVGGGLAGLYAIHRLRSIGLKVRAYEAGSGVGGTWFWNRYPGARCDVESLEYSYSFDDQLQQDWKWPERYGTQPEILKYINHVADRFDLRRDVQLNTRIKSAVFDRTANEWTLATDSGEQVRARYCVMAAGNLSTPRVPDFKGLRDFKGKWYHSGLWPHEGVDFTGLRVGVIGTGSSGVQMIPLIAEQAKHLTVFQRTANFSLPARNGPMELERERNHKAEYPARRRAAHDTPFAIAGYPKPTKSALDAPDEERNAAYEAKWQEGGSISYLYAYTDLLVNKASNDTASEFVRNKIRTTVKDRRTAELLAPKDHPIGTKRLCLDTNYYETYNRPNVALVDVRSDPIDHITAAGLSLKSGAAFELDAIVFATGFDAMTGALREIDVRTSDGAVLRDQLGGRAAHLSRPDGGGLPQHVRGHRARQPGREDPDDRLDRAARRLDRRCHRPSREAPARPHRADAQGRDRLGAPRQPGGQFDALSAGQLLVHGRQHPGQAAGVHAICRRLRPLQEALR